VFLRLKALLEPFGLTRFYTNHWGAYTRHLDPDMHSPGKRNTQKIERKHLTLRTRIKRLVRKTICFSKTIQMHDIVLGYSSIDMPLDCLSKMLISTFRTLPGGFPLRTIQITGKPAQAVLTFRTFRHPEDPKNSSQADQQSYRLASRSYLSGSAHLSQHMRGASGSFAVPSLICRNRCTVAYLLGADNISTPLLSCLDGPHQPVINLRNGLSRPHSTQLTGWQAHLSCLASRSSSLPIPYTT